MPKPTTAAIVAKFLKSMAVDAAGTWKWEEKIEQSGEFLYTSSKRR